MTNQKPPLEFYVLDSLYENERRAYKSKPTGHDSIHVIGHSAYLSEKTKREQFEKLAGEMREALEFYSDSDNWGHTSPGCATYDRIDEKDFGAGNFEIGHNVDDDRVGGRKAREALAKFDEALRGIEK